MSHLHIRLLGEFSLAYGDVPLTTVNTLRPQTLLAYLVLHRDAPQSRQRLAFLLWPDSTEEQARTNLRHVLYQIRQALPDADRFLVIDTQAIQWNLNGPFALDVLDFERATQRAASRSDLEAAVELYRGDLLPSCYDDWVRPKRERLHQMYLSALEQLIQMHENRRDYSRAIAYAQQLLHSDPLHEDTYRYLMRLYAANGDRAGALHVYHTCTTVLQRELGVEPGPAIQAVFRRLLDLETQPPPAKTSATLPLIGREREWSDLQRAWRGTTAHRSHFVLITGEAGIGKTRLAEELFEWANRQGIETARASCHAPEIGLAYAPVVMWLQARPLPALDEIWLTEITRLLPELAIGRAELPRPEPLTESWQRHRLFKALVHAVLDGRPALMLLLEDVHWCDRESLEWLEFLLRSHADIAPQTRLLIVGTQRVEEPSRDQALTALLADLRHTDQVIEVELGPLSATETAELAAGVTGRALTLDRAEQFFRETEGNPLFVVEIARAQSNSAISRSLPPKVHEVIELRLSRLSSFARDLASAAATIGREFTFRVLRHAAGSDDEALVRGLDELWQRRIVREQGQEEYDFSHDKIREVAYATVSSARRRLFHRRVAEALVEVHASHPDLVAGQIAAHFVQAGDSTLACTWSVRAGQYARRTYALDGAIQYYQTALSCLPSHAEFGQRVSLCQELGEMLHLQARFAEARMAYAAMRQAAAQLDDPIAQAKAWNGLAQVQDSAADHQGALISAHAAERLARSAGSPARLELARALSLQGLAHYRLGNPGDAIRLAEEVLEICTTAGSEGRRQTARALNLLGAVYTMLGDFDQARACRERALTIFRELNDEVWIGHILNNLGEIARQRGDYAEAIHWYGEALRTAEQIGNREGEAIYRCNLGAAQVRQGVYEAAAEELRQALAISSTGYWTSEAHSSLAEALLRQGKIAEAEQAARQALKLGEEINAKEAVGIAWRVLGMVTAAQRRAILIHDTAYDAAACFSQSERLLAEIGAEVERTRTLREWSIYSDGQEPDQY